MIKFILSLTLLSNICLCDQLVNINRYKKCCKDNEHLILQRDNYYNCTLNNYKLYNYFRPNVTHLEHENNTNYCVDVSLKEIQVNLLLLNSNKKLMNDIDLKLNQVQTFHKCCPLGYVYVKKERKCTAYETKNHENLIKNASLVTVGFLHCNNTVIRDVFFNNYHDANTYAKKFNFDHYCFDETIDNNYVIRKCESKDVCDDTNVICLHKCCPDGYNYNNSRFCSKYPHFESGFDYTAVTNTSFKSK